MATTFNRSLTAVAQRASTDRGTAAHSLLNQVVALQATADAVALADYRSAYESGGADFYVQTVAGIDAAYQQMHAAVAAAAQLVGANVHPAIRTRTLVGLQNGADATGPHPLAGQLRAIRREVELLRWLSTVRNKAVQHRSEEGYLESMAIVLVSAFVVSRKPGPPPASELRKARSLLRGLIRRYGLSLDPGDGEREAVAYLDVISHALLPTSPAEYDAARTVVAAAGMHDLIVSHDLFTNADGALAALIGLSPTRPSVSAAP
jgi:hypothetical protein